MCALITSHFIVAPFPKGQPSNDRVNDFHKAVKKACADFFTFLSSRQVHIKPKAYFRTLTMSQTWAKNLVMIAAAIAEKNGINANANVNANEMSLG